MAFFISAVAFAAHTAVATVAQKPKNVVFFFVDDLGYGNLMSTGDPSASTPSIDSLAAQGKRLTNWYSGYPVCSASRTALLTGRQPSRVGMVGVINSLTSSGLPLDEVTLADEMKASGYRTLALGKWHQGQLPSYLPTNRGFDEFLGLPFSVDDGAGYLSPCGNMSVGERTARIAAASNAASMEQERHWSDVGAGLGPLLPLPLIRQIAAQNVSEIVEQPTDLRLLTSRLLDHAVGFVRTHHQDPLFVYFAFGHVHTATETIAPDRQYSGCAFVGRTPRAFHDALAEVDHAIGTLLHEVEALGQARDTLTLFTSDNGPSLRWRTGAGGVGPFVGASATFANGTIYTNTGKGSTWEGGIRMPAFAHWPGRVRAGSAASSVVSTLDVLPSLLHLLGRPTPGRTLDGSLALAEALLLDTTECGRGEQPCHEEGRFLPFYNEPAYANASHRIFAARYGRYKAHWITSPGLGGGLLPYRSPVPEVHHATPVLYDVAADPAEAFPLAVDTLPPELLHELAAQKHTYEVNLKPTSINTTWGYEYALCCGVGCTPPCVCQCKGVQLPTPA